ncbi:MAG: 2-oxo acid dehydrogenase subunit E2 [Holosporaceae bacterium]|jgi:pyruvate/2-oxoglutarate dehydrogenase complex dihydrolipoamide acyltransferase (E2) component|nr:2-oxo acid dehydrogenase subunit E2 [Holosporaceae bacterium]
MRIDIYIPDFDVSAEEITLSTWYKKVGDKISKNEVIADAETAQISCGITSSYDCILAEIVVQEGEVVSHGTKIAIIETELDADISDIKRHTLVNEIRQKSAIVEGYLKKDLVKRDEQEKCPAAEEAKAAARKQATERQAQATAEKQEASSRSFISEGKQLNEREAVSSFEDKKVQNIDGDGYCFSVPSSPSDSLAPSVSDSLIATEASVTKTANMLEASVELNAIEAAEMLKSDNALVERYSEDVIEELSDRTEEKFLNILKSAGEKGKEEAKKLMEEIIIEAKKQALQQAESLKSKILKEYEEKALRDAAEAHQKIVQGSIVEAENTRTKIIKEMKEKAEEEAEKLRIEIIQNAESEAKAQAADTIISNIMQAKENANTEAERISREIIENAIQDAKSNAKEVKKDIIHSANKHAAKEALHLIKITRNDALKKSRQQAAEIIKSSLQQAKIEADSIKSSILQAANLEAELVKNDIVQSAAQEAEAARENVIKSADEEAELIKSNILQLANQEAELMKSTMLQSANREAELMKSSILEAANREIANAVGCMMFEVKEKSAREIRQAIEKIAIHETEMIKKGLLQSTNTAGAQCSIGSIINNLKERTNNDIKSIIYTLSKETELLKNRLLQCLNQDIKETVSSLMSEITEKTSSEMKNVLRHMADTFGGRMYTDHHANGHHDEYCCANLGNYDDERRYSGNGYDNACRDCDSNATDDGDWTPNQSRCNEKHGGSYGDRHDGCGKHRNKHSRQDGEYNNNGCGNVETNGPAKSYSEVVKDDFWAFINVNGTEEYASTTHPAENNSCLCAQASTTPQKCDGASNGSDPSPQLDDLHRNGVPNGNGTEFRSCSAYADGFAGAEPSKSSHTSAPKDELRDDDDIHINKSSATKPGDQHADACKISTEADEGWDSGGAFGGNGAMATELSDAAPADAWLPKNGMPNQEEFARHLLRQPLDEDSAIHANNWNKPKFFSSPNDETVPLDILKQRIHAKMKESLDAAVISTVSNEVDMSSILSLEKNFGDAFTKKYNTRLGFTPFFIVASISSLKKYRIFNAHIYDNNIIYKSNFDISIITCGNEGVAAPVIRHADKLSIAEIEKIMINLSRRAIEGTLSIEEVSGGTFTVVNAGVYGSIMGTDLLTPPQVATLSVHRMHDRPVATDGGIEIKPMLYISLSYDHRIADTKKASEFLESVKRYVENPGWNMLDL